MTNSALLDLLQLAATYSTRTRVQCCAIPLLLVQLLSVSLVWLQLGLSQSQFSILMMDGALHGATSSVLEYDT